MYRTLARWCYHRRWTVVGVWIALVVGMNIAGSALGAGFDADFESPDSESKRGAETMQEYFGGAGSNFGGQLVIESADGVVQPTVVEPVTELLAEVDGIEGVTVVSPYTEIGAQQISADGTIAFARIDLDPAIDQTEASEIGADIRELAADIDTASILVGGSGLAEFEPPESELIGLAFAIVILILSFGSVLAMGIPIGVALAGVITGGFGLVALLNNTFSIPEFAPIIAIMIGLGVGIDYALFIVTRYRELTHAGADPEQATIGAMDTAGRAVVFAGITVVLSLLGMLFIGLEFIAGLGVAAASTVFVTLLASITLLPALIAIAADRIEVTRWRGLITAGFAAIALLGVGLGIPAMGLAGAVLALGTIIASLAFRPLRERVPQRKQKPIRETTSYRWSHLIQARPWMFFVLGAGALIVLSAPVMSLRLGFSDEGNFSPETDTRQAYDLVAEGFGPGFNGPIILAAEIDSPADAALIQELATAIDADPGVAQLAGPIPNDPNQPEAFQILVIPTTSPQDEVTEETVLRLRDEVIAPIVAGSEVEVNLTGAVAGNIDFSDYLGDRVFVFYGVVLSVSFLLLMMVFRSLLVPLKAVIMNMLSITAAYGAVVAIFQWGWFGFVEPAPIEPFVPMMLFAIVFGLSMDYEVFLLSRVKEEYDRTGDAVNSVADGLAATARVITAAAAIMVVVFGSFLLEDDRVVKLFGTGLALAVFLDATLVRMLLVPATMELLGSRNWWFPKWLDRIVPTLNVEGHELEELHANLGEQADEQDERVPVDA